MTGLASGRLRQPLAIKKYLLSSDKAAGAVCVSSDRADDTSEAFVRKSRRSRNGWRTGLAEDAELFRDSRKSSREVVRHASV